MIDIGVFVCFQSEINQKKRKREMLWSSTKERATKAYPGKQLVRNTHEKDFDD